MIHSSNNMIIYYILYYIRVLLYLGPYLLKEQVITIITKYYIFMNGQTILMSNFILNVNFVTSVM